MSEILYRSFDRKNPRVAENTYRFVWDNLRAHNIMVYGPFDRQNNLHLPQMEEDPRRKLFIPGSSVMRVAAMGDEEFYVTTGLNDRRDIQILGNRQIRASFREVNKIYQGHLDAVLPLHRIDAGNLRWLIPVGLVGYLLDKFIQNTPAVPEFMQGRMVDFMAIPTIMMADRFINGFIRKRRMVGQIDSLVGDPENYVGKLFNYDLSIARNVLMCYLVEIGQGLDILPGTFDVGDFVAYTAGAIPIWGLYKLRERRFARFVRGQLEKSQQRRD